ncbi:MAG: thermonuclease family protein [Nitrospirae bacterium]|nr:thermonuclease family protein [Nitrospirota bacterium]
MSELKNESVHLIITSPPYWQLKDYGNGSQIGFNDTYEDYINNLNLVWNECYRVLHKGCRLCVNIGDQFARSVYYGRYKIIPIREEIIKFCETIGFDYMGAIIWQKVTTCNTTGGATVMGSFPYPRNGIIKLDYEFILIFKKLGESPKVSREIREKSKLTKDEWNEYFYGHWNFSGERQDKHLAMFPEELPKRLIKMFSFVGDTVLDPFLGSGTTCLAAKNLDRNSIGYEINKDFLPVIKSKLNIYSSVRANKSQSSVIAACPQSVQNHKERFPTSGNDNNGTFDAEIVIQEKSNIDFKDEIKKLPYIFKDPVKFDKKIDQKKLRFGSRIDHSEHAREMYHTVKEILSPELLILDNGLKVRLIGVKEKNEANGEAVKFLREKFKGERVFMKYDSQKFDKDGNLLCYIYLKNKTFINVHLIKAGLASVDTLSEFKYKSKFIAENG